MFSINVNLSTSVHRDILALWPRHAQRRRYIQINHQSCPSCVSQTTKPDPNILQVAKMGDRVRVPHAPQPITALTSHQPVFRNPWTTTTSTSTTTPSGQQQQQASDPLQTPPTLTPAPARRGAVSEQGAPDPATPVARRPSVLRAEAEPFIPGSQQGHRLSADLGQANGGPTRPLGQLKGGLAHAGQANDLAPSPPRPPPPPAAAAAAANHARNTSGTTTTSSSHAPPAAVSYRRGTNTSSPQQSSEFTLHFPPKYLEQPPSDQLRQSSTS